MKQLFIVLLDGLLGSIDEFMLQDKFISFYPIFRQCLSIKFILSFLENSEDTPSCSLSTVLGEFTVSSIMKAFATMPQ